MKTFITLFFLSTNLMASECQEKDIKIIFDRKPVLTKEVICLKKTADNMVFYVSKSCATGKCDVLKKKKTLLKIENFYSNMGSPGFKLCEELGGVPQIFEFKNTKDVSFQSAERCLFSKNDFLENSLLIKEWKSFIRE